MSNIIIQATILSGTALLLAAFVPIKGIYSVLPQGLTRFVWVCLSGLIGFSVFGYLLFLRLNMGVAADNHRSGLVATVLFLAAMIVFTVCTMSNSAAKDIASIAVLEHAARVDPLTNLYNRRHIMALFEEESSQSIYYGTTLSVLLLDIDRFKTINDTFGHRTGDHVLRKISSLLAQVDIGCNLIGRFGGEEFLIILPNTSQSEAIGFAEHIRATVEAEPISFENDPFIPVTISIGVAASSRLNESPDELIALADTALYAAKASGRNQVRTTPSRPRYAGRPESSPSIQPSFTSLGVSKT